MNEPPAEIGRYRVERLIAHGGMGSLFLARDPAIDRLVAIKLLKEGFDDPEGRERFARESRAAGRLQHPNIVTVYDVGEHDRHPFIAMQYVPGETVAQLIRRRAPTRITEKLDLLEQLCVGLHHAHGQGVVHRDIKPANVMVDAGGAVKILDFGIARAEHVPMTAAGQVVGTLNYMSPEQLAGAHVDHRTDIYAVGVLGYELITHQMAYPGTVGTGVLFKILESQRVPIASLVPGVDPDVVAILDRAMAKDREDRYEDAEALRLDLVTVRDRLLALGVDAVAPADENAETLYASVRPASGALAQTPPRSSALRHSATAVVPPGPPAARRSPVVLIAAAALSAAVLLAVFLLRGGPAPGERAGAGADVASSPPAVASPPESAGGAAATPPGAAVDRLAEVRDAARRQMAAGGREQALATLAAGLALAAGDPEINRLVEELGRGARSTAEQARQAALRRGVEQRSGEFREARARERDGVRLAGDGDSIKGIETLWAAAALYDRAPSAAARLGAGSSDEPAPRAAAPAPPPPPPDPAAPVPAPIPAYEPPRTGIASPPAPVVPSGVPAPAPSTPPREPSQADTRAADTAAVRDLLRRYVAAYESRDSAAVGRLIPSLTAEQLRGLERDFANYRTYEVVIRAENIQLAGPTATVTCEVVRSFVTRTGVAGGHTVDTVFSLRRDGPTWRIDRVDSR